MSQYLTFQVAEIAAGILALLWAVAKRRSPIDAIPLASVGLLLLLLSLGWDEVLRFRQFYMFPEVLLGVLGIALVVLAFVSRGRRDHRLGTGAAGLEVDSGSSEASGTPDAQPDQAKFPSRVHRVGLGVVGCLIMIPLLLLLALIGAFIIGSGHDRSPDRTPAASNRQ